MENLRHFLNFLERKKILNPTEVVQDRAKMNSLIQEIMKVDFKEFISKHGGDGKQKSKKTTIRASSGAESNNSSQSRAQARRRQGTPVNVNNGVTPRG